MKKTLRFLPFFLALIAIGNLAQAQCNIITTIAGTGSSGSTGDGGAATSALLNSPHGVAIDRAGNIYFCDNANNKVRKITPAGIITTIAGTGTAGNSGDAGPATAALLNAPNAVAVDVAGNVYIADKGNNRVRRILAQTGTIYNYAGNSAGSAGSTGDGSTATSGKLNAPNGVAVDKVGNLYISDDGNNKIRKVKAGGGVLSILSTYAGDGTAAFTGDGGQATAARIDHPTGVAVDADGNVYFSDNNNHRVRKIDNRGIINTVAGNGGTSYSGEGIPATSATINYPAGITFDALGNMYVSDYGQNRLRRISTTGIITTVTGSASAGYSGDGGAAASAQINGPLGVVADANNNLYFSDLSNNVIRKITSGDPIVGPITGVTMLLAGGTTSFADTTYGGTWTSSNTSVASISTTGGTYGVSSGRVTIIYTVTNGCNSIAATRNITVSPAFTACNTISTVAGGTGRGYTGDGGAATAAQMYNPTHTAMDKHGNLYISDYNNHVIRKVSPSGTITTFAGTGSGSFSGDGGQASAAAIRYPQGVYVDNNDVVYIADAANSVIRKVDTNGIISTIAGNQLSASNGDGGPAGNASLSYPVSITGDADGNLYFAEVFGYKVRKIDKYGMISTVAGIGSSGYAGDGGAATAAQIHCYGICLDGNGNLYIGDHTSHKVRKVSTSGIITHFAGNGSTTFSGDGGPATAAGIYSINSVVADAIGNILIGHQLHVRMVDASGTIVTVAGNGYGGLTGDGGSATAAGVGFGYGLSIDTAGNTYIADYGNDAVRKLVASGPASDTISGSRTVAIGGATTLVNNIAGGIWSSSNPAVASISSTGVVTGLVAGTVIITCVVTNSCGTTSDTMMMSVTAPLGRCAVISTIAGTGTAGFGGDGGTATAALLSTPIGMAKDAAGNIYFTDQANCRVRKITTSGVISTIAGSGTPGFSGDGGPATAAQLNYPLGIALDAAGNIYVADRFNYRVRKIDAAGVITTFAGDGTPGAAGDGSAATTAHVNATWGLAVDRSGDLFISDEQNHKIRKVTGGIISTFAGSGTAGYSGDGGAAITAQLNTPTGITVDTAGNVYFGEFVNNVVRKVSTTGTITTVAGTGSAGYSGDGGAATAASLNVPTGVYADSFGNIYISDRNNNRVRQIDNSGNIFTIGGNGTSGYTGDGGAATAAQLYYPTGIIMDNSGSICFAEYNNNVLRKITFGTPVLTDITGANTIVNGASTTLANATGGGTWSSSNGSIATVNSAGVVTGLSVGTAIISYSLSNACGSTSDTLLMSVTFANTAPTFNAGASQSITMCENASAQAINSQLAATDLDASQTLNWTLLSAALHGTASVSYTTTSTGASITPTGLTYTPTTGYSGTDSFKVRINDGTDADTITIYATINPLPNPGAISGPTSVTIGGTITLTDTPSGGAWSSSDFSKATVSSTGVVTGVAAGFATISYGVTNLCGTTYATMIVTVGTNNTPTFDGGASQAITICENASAASINSELRATDADAGQSLVWSMVSGPAHGSASVSYAATSIAASITPTGLTYTPTTGYSGMDSFTVRITDGSASDTIKILVTINPAASAGTISGGATVCVGSNITLTSTVTGGTWSTADATVASVNTTGSVRGVSVGATTISYSVSGCGTAVSTQSMTVGLSPVAGTLSGVTTFCQGATNTLTPSVSGGSWTSTNPAIATVNASGLVYGLTPGSTTVTYTISGSCGSATVTKTQTVNPLPVVGPITGINTACVGYSSTLSDSTTGGTWSSSTPSVATVNATTGLVYAASLGTATITYTVSNSCGPTRVTTNYTVSSSISAGTISGPTTICAGGTSSLTSSNTGGTWTSGSTTVATISSGGVVTGVAAGLAHITYTLSTACGIAYSYDSVTVNPAPNPGVITGPSAVCPGNNITLTDTTTGGTWSSSSATTATVSATGVVTGLAAGTATISYSATNGCGTLAATHAVTVNPLPGAATISGGTQVCLSGTTALTTPTTGGTWSSSNTTIATVSTSGLVSGVSLGTAIITYTYTNSCGTTTDTAMMAVNTAPTAGTISGTTTVCTGASTTLGSSVSGGTWSSNNTTIATISTSGVVRGVSAGTTTISYVVATPCGVAVATTTVTVTGLPNAGTLSGTTTACTGGTATLTPSVSGGTWSSGSISIATVDAAGVVTGVAAGTATISYAVTNSCGTRYTTTTFTVTGAPSAGTLSGTTTLCTAGGTTTLSPTIGGGTWSTSNAGVASVNSLGVVTGGTAGTATISYTVTSSCGTGLATIPVTVTTGPSAGTISGATTVCAGTTTTLSSSTGSGSWSTSDASIASVDAATGVVSGMATGTATVTYTVTSSCGTTTATTGITVNTIPATGTVTGPGSLCTGASTGFTATPTGGTWSSSNTAIASVNTSGVVHGNATGTALISYTWTNTCGSVSTAQSISVAPATTVAPITGGTTTCTGTSITLADTTSGGTWLSSNNTIAVVSTAGVVTGVAAGTVNISYIVSGTCGSATAIKTVTVIASPVPGTIGGITSLCTGGTSTLTNATSGGTWSSATPAVATISTTGSVTALTAGTTIISYTVTGSCGAISATTTVTVSTGVSAGSISSTAAIICESTVATFSDSVTGGTWSSSNTAVATVSTTGDVTGNTAGTATITYTVTNGCGTARATAPITVLAAPAAGSISGAGTICLGTPGSLSSSVTGGIWSSSDTTVAAVSTTGTVTGISNGAATISYTITNSCGSATATHSVTVNSTPTVSAITGTTTVCAGATTTLTDTTTGGTWTTSAATVASVDVSGNVSGISAGSAVITYTVSNACGNARATATITVNAAPAAGTLSGVTTICTGTTTTLSSTVTGGTWSTSDATVASVNTSGIVTGISVGGAVISYSVTNSCGTATATTGITVSTGATAGTIAGASSVCIGAVSSYSVTGTGGTWSTSDATIASVNTTGMVTGTGIGTATISYSVSSSCGISVATASVTVNGAPSAGTISGSTAVCAGATTTLTPSVGGGTWSSSTTTVATISTTGTVSGLTAGTTTITYAVTGTCGTGMVTTTFTVNNTPTVGAITGTTTTCAGFTTTLSNASTGGSWTSSNAAVATVDAAGVVTGVSAGSATITYAITNACGTASATTGVTITSGGSAGTLTGPSAICTGTTGTFATTSAGGTWSVSNPSVATINATGIVTGLAAGTVTVSYSVSTACGTSVATASVIVSTMPSAGAISGPSSLCTGAVGSYSVSASGGTWSSSNPSIATISTSGIVTTVATGTVTISYSVTSAGGCTAVATHPLTSGSGAPTGVITPGGSVTLCGGTPVHLVVSSASGSLTYQWYRNGVLIAGATTSGYTASIAGSYAAIINNGCGVDTTNIVSVINAPNPTILHSGINTLSTGSYSTYQWFKNGVIIAGATTSVYIYSTPGVYTVRVSDGNGCQATSAPYTVTDGGTSGIAETGITTVSVYPNPATSVLHIEASAIVHVMVMTADGRTLMHVNDAREINISDLASGMYMILIYDENNHLLKTEKLIKSE